MPSNSTVTHPSPSLRPLPSQGPLRATLLAGLLTFALVLGIFIAYAYLAPATYRTSALVTVEAAGGARATLPPAREAAQRLKRALVRPQILTAISNGVLPNASPAQGAELHDHLRTRTEIETADSSTYRVSCLLPAARLAEHACNAMATKLVELAPDVLDPGPSPEEQAKDKERQRRTDELVAFLAAHPELSAQPSPAPDAPSSLPSEAKDRTLMLLRQERGQIEARLAASRLPPTTDNPYDDPSALLAETTLLKRRLAEINGSVQSRRAALAAPTAPRAQKPAPALVAEWQRLLGAVAEVGGSSMPTPGGGPRLQARIASVAKYPGSPIEPNRQLLLLVGLLVALGTGILAAVTQNAIESRPGKRRGLPRSAPTERRAPRDASELPSSGPMLAAAALDPSATQSNLEHEDTERAPRSQPPSQPGRSPSDPASADWALKLSHELSDSAPESASKLAQLAPKPAGRTPSQRRLELVEVNAPVGEPSEAESKPDADKAVVPHRFSAARSTQMLGSPITPVFPARGAPLAAHPAETLSRATPSGGYSYVSSPPPGERSPPSSSPRAAPALASSSEAPAGPAASSSAPSAAATPLPRTVVTTHRVPAGWQPEPSLLPETHRSLFDELYPLAVQQCFVIAISGVPGSSEETSRVASELALGLSDTGHPRILLVEANFQRPAVQRWMDLEVPLLCGFSEQLQTRALEGSSGPWNVVECSPALHVLAEGVMRAPELIRSPQFAQAMRDLREHYDFIVINAPLTSEKAACRAVQDLVDGVIVVYPKTSSPPLAEASSLFSEKRYSTVLAAR